MQPSIGYSEAMTGAAKKLVEELLKLSAEERAEAAEGDLVEGGPPQIGIWNQRA